MARDAVEAWKRHFLPMSDVKAQPPKWIVPGLLVPGMNIVVGPPKCGKSFLVLNLIASILEKHHVGEAKDKRVATTYGPCVYFAAEQSARSLKHNYETRVIKKRKGDKNKRTSWDFIVPKNPWKWQVDEPEDDLNLEVFLNEWNPLLAVIDPLIYFHSFDENDPKLIRPLVPLREWALRTDHAFVVVHHTRKSSGNQQGSGGNGTSDWDRVRGTSALFGMADGALMLTPQSQGLSTVTATFKDQVASTWAWRWA